MYISFASNIANYLQLKLIIATASAIYKSAIIEHFQQLIKNCFHWWAVAFLIGCHILKWFDGYNAFRKCVDMYNFETAPENKLFFKDQLLHYRKAYFVI